MGLRLFEGTDLLRLFNSPVSTQSEDVDIRPGTAGFDASMTSGETHISSTVPTPLSEGIRGPSTAPGATSFASGTTGRIINLTSPRMRHPDSSDVRLYDMEAPPGENDENV